MSWQLILKEIPFKVRDFRAIDKKARKIWNDGGRKEKLGEILVRLVKEKYKSYTSLENLLEDFAKFKELDMEEMMDVYPLMETLLQVDQAPKGKRSGFDKFEDSEIMRQLEIFRDKLEREEKRRELKETTPKRKRKKTIPKKEINNKLDSFEDSFPKSAQMFRDWIKSTSYAKLNELLSLVGSPAIGNDETIGRLKKFIKDSELNKKDEKALTDIANEMVKESNLKPKSNRRLSGNVVQSRALGLEMGKNSKMSKTQLTIKYAGDKSLEIKGKQRNFLDNFERLDLTKDRFYNNTYTREIFEYWVEESGYTGTAEKFIKDPDKSKYIKKIMRSIPEYPTNDIKVGLLYRDIFKDPEAGLIIEEDKAPEEFAYFLQGLRDGITGGKSSRTAFDFNTLKKFNNRILPELISAIKAGVFVDEEGNRDFRLGPPVSKLMNRLSKEQEDKREIISVIGDVIRGKNISDKYQGSDKDTLAKIESDIRDQLKEKIAGKTVASYLLTTFMQLYKREGILSSILNTKTVIPVEYLTPQEAPKTETKKEPKGSDRIKVLRRGVYEETKKSLDNLLVAIGEEDEIIIKEDIGLILESLDKKQKKKVKAILNIADPTEYFGHDFLKLSELIRLLKTLGVVKGDKKLNKKILRYDEENVKVVKLAARLRKDYERLYDDLREMIYPKSGE